MLAASITTTTDDSVRNSMTQGMQDRLCPGCKKSVVTEDGGLVVAFGQSFFHVDCFRCAKCQDQVTADTNLLLLSDGSPICANCSYSCSVCHEPILDEAIMTGEDSYHAHCFKCKICGRRIEELVFARTSQGIYCMECHNERMIKIRKHAQRKAERERNGGSGSSRSRDQTARDLHRENGRASPAYPGSARSYDALSTSQSRAGDLAESQPGSSRGTESSTARSSNRSRGEDAFDPNTSAAHSPQTNAQRPPSSPTIAVTVASGDGDLSKPGLTLRTSYLSQRSESPSLAEFGAKPAPTKNNTLPIPQSGDGGKAVRRKSYDDGVRPLNVLFDAGYFGVQQEPENASNLIPPTSRKDKRRSINPGLVLGEAGKNLISSSSTLLSPISVNFGGLSGNRPVSPPSSGDSHGYDDPHASWPPSNRSTATSTTSEQWRDANSQFSRPSSLNGSDERKSFESHARPARSSLASSLNVRSNSGSRPNSPGHQVDVPHSVESGTDEETEVAEEGTPLPHADAPPAPPPKEARSPSDTNLPRPPISDDFASPPDTSVLAGVLDSESDDLSEASPIETSHTFIAPALPPFRFSLPADFSDLLTAVGGDSASKLVAKAEPLLPSVPENIEVSPTTPPPTASSTVSDGISVSSGASTVVASQLDSPQLLSTAIAQGSPKESVNEAKEIDSLRSMTNGTAKPRGPRRSTERATRPSTAPSSGSSPAISPHPLSHSAGRSPSTDSVNGMFSPTIMITESDLAPPAKLLSGGTDLVVSRLQEVLADAQQRGAQQVKLDKLFLEVILGALDHKRSENSEMKSRLDGMKRESRQYIEGLTVAQTEYDKELKARRDAESEVTRLRVLLSGQAARLTAMSEESRCQQLRQQLTKELNDNLTGLERNLSKLRVERDVTVAEVEELLASKSSTTDNPETHPPNLGRSLTKRLDTIKSRYQRELIPLEEHKETLAREIAELKAVRDVFLEETTVLNARNEELARLSTHYSRRMDTLPETPSKSPVTNVISPNRPRGSSMDRNRSLPLSQHLPPPITSTTSLPVTSTPVYDDDGKFINVQKADIDMPTPGKKGFKWAHLVNAIGISDGGSRGKPRSEHAFQQISNVRFTRCDHCGDKMWGSQLRCSACGVSVHVRCHNHVVTSCSQQSSRQREEPTENLPPSMFGRELAEQVRADSKGNDRQVPIIVEKCIAAVETLALDYEGIYRKTGGSSHTKAITQLFERGDYDAFDLTDPERFNDICSITSVLKTYFRSLPIPLLTYDLHDSLMSAIQLRDASVKNVTLINLINQLPSEYYHTLRLLMLHLNNVSEHSTRNLMNSRNLGVVFGPTLLRSQDPSAEFSDMGHKALFVEWIVENAPLVFGNIS